MDEHEWLQQLINNYNRPLKRRALFGQRIIVPSILLYFFFLLNWFLVEDCFEVMISSRRQAVHSVDESARLIPDEQSRQSRFFQLLQESSPF